MLVQGKQMCAHKEQYTLANTNESRNSSLGFRIEKVIYSKNHARLFKSRFNAAELSREQVPYWVLLAAVHYLSCLAVDTRIYFSLSV